jgi:hypothetical protein
MATRIRSNNGTPRTAAYFEFALNLTLEVRHATPLTCRLTRTVNGYQVQTNTTAPDHLPVSLWLDPDTPVTDACKRIVQVYAGVNAPAQQVSFSF